MLKRHPISEKQAALFRAAEATFSEAQNRYQIIAQTLMLGVDADTKGCMVMGVDPELPVLIYETEPGPKE